MPGQDEIGVLRGRKEPEAEKKERQFLSSNRGAGEQVSPEGERLSPEEPRWARGEEARRADRERWKPERIGRSRDLRVPGAERQPLAEEQHRKPEEQD